MSVITGGAVGWSHVLPTNEAVVSGASKWIIDPATVPDGWNLCAVGMLSTVEDLSSYSGELSVLLCNAVPASHADGFPVFAARASGWSGGVAGGLRVPAGYGLYWYGTGDITGLSVRVHWRAP